MEIHGKALVEFFATGPADPQPVPVAHGQLVLHDLCDSLQVHDVTGMRILKSLCAKLRIPILQPLVALQRLPASSSAGFYSEPASPLCLFNVKNTSDRDTLRLPVAGHFRHLPAAAPFRFQQKLPDIPHSLVYVCAF